MEIERRVRGYVGVTEKKIDIEHEKWNQCSCNASLSVLSKCSRELAKLDSWIVANESSCNGVKSIGRREKLK